MLRHDNTLYITTQKSYLAREGTNLLVRVEKETRARFPVHTLGGVVCFGNVSCSPFVMDLCGREGVPIAFFTERGRFLARVEGAQSGNVLLRRAQHAATAEPHRAAQTAQAMVSAKIANSRTVLQRVLRDHADAVVQADAVRSVIRRLAGLLRELDEQLPLERLRGVEGDAARQYFGVFDHLILAQKEAFVFHERTRRPPMDNMNALLSFLYAILANDYCGACESVGLDSQMGFLHADRPGRPSLALDLMESLRSVVADRLALSLVNRQQIRGKGFCRQESGAVQMADDTRRTILKAYQQRKGDELMHPFLNEKVKVGLLPLVQARLLARYLRGDLDGYPSFFWR